MTDRGRWWRAVGRLALVGLVGVGGGCARGVPPSVPEARIAIVGDSVRTTELAPGVSHHLVWRGAGPWVIHVLEIDPVRCDASVVTVRARDRIEGLEPTSSQAARAGQGIVAAVNGDFFSARPPGLTIGAQVVAGEVVKRDGPHPRMEESTVVPGRDAYGVDAAGRHFVRRITVTSWVRTLAGTRAGVEINAVPDTGGLALFNRFGAELLAEGHGLEVYPLTPITEGLVGDTMVGIVGGAGPPWLVERRRAGWGRLTLAPGDTVRWGIEVEGASGSVRELIGGYPLLLQGGIRVFRVPGLRPAFADERHPRTAVGIRGDGRVLVLVVDGRRPGYSVGMTLEETTALLLEFGALDALNLDGGGSTTLVVSGQVVNRPTDGGGERAVANALAVVGGQRCGG